MQQDRPLLRHPAILVAHQVDTVVCDAGGAAHDMRITSIRQECVSRVLFWCDTQENYSEDEEKEEPASYCVAKTLVKDALQARRKALLQEVGQIEEELVILG